jgi:hypothetical protein
VGRRLRDPCWVLSALESLEQSGGSGERQCAPEEDEEEEEEINEAEAAVNDERGTFFE